MYEIEIKSLLGSKERADELKRRLAELFPAHKIALSHRQKNHYFNAPNDLRVIGEAVVPFYQSKEQREALFRILRNARGDVSVRTREADGIVSFVAKTTIGDDSSANGVSRIEFDEPVALSLEALDKKLLDAGAEYQAKWSREREEFNLGAARVTIDRNAGYGYLAEFEKMVSDETEAREARRELTELMKRLGCEELPQDRLERMFKFYNAHWREYYGTEKIFVVE